MCTMGCSRKYATITVLLALAGICVSNDELRKNATSEPYDLGYVGEGAPNVSEANVTSLERPMLVREAGSQLTLMCRAPSADLHWIYPGLSPNATDHLRLPKHGRINITLEREPTDNSIWLATFTVNEITHIDTGEYACIFRSPNPGQPGGFTTGLAVERRSVFVFVSDPTRLFQGRPSEYGPISAVQAVTGRSARLPCGVTSPKTRVLLYRATGADRLLLMDWTDSSDGRAAVNVSRFWLSSLHYEPSYGFQLNASTQRADGLYLCRAERGGAAEERRILLFVADGSSEALGTPWLWPPMVAYTYNWGSALDITCGVHVRKRNPITVFWTKNNDSIQASNNGRVSITPLAFSSHSATRYTEVTSRLRIGPILTTDAGEYECIALSVGNRRSVRRTVIVLDSTDFDNEHYDNDDWVKESNSDDVSSFV